MRCTSRKSDLHQDFIPPDWWRGSASFLLLLLLRYCLHIHMQASTRARGPVRSVFWRWSDTDCWDTDAMLHPQKRTASIRFSLCSGQFARKFILRSVNPSFSDSFHFFFVRPVISVTSGTLKSHNFIFASLIFFLNIFNYFLNKWSKNKRMK